MCYECRIQFACRFREFARLFFPPFGCICLKRSDWFSKQCSVSDSEMNMQPNENVTLLVLDESAGSMVCGRDEVEHLFTFMKASYPLFIFSLVFSSCLRLFYGHSRNGNARSRASFRLVLLGCSIRNLEFSLKRKFSL